MEKINNSAIGDSWENVKKELFTPEEIVEIEASAVLNMENTKCHEVERFENLMYKGCESHWHCIYCDDYWPFHCYGKKDLEQMECPARKVISDD